VLPTAIEPKATQSRDCHFDTYSTKISPEVTRFNQNVITLPFTSNPSGINGVIKFSITWKAFNAILLKAITLETQRSLEMMQRQFQA
jgi:hypothetical protein